MMTETVTVYEVYADGRLVDITADVRTAERHSTDHDRRVFAETAEVSA